ncbi:MAG: hypothetical protein ACLFSQ_13075 [Candidatus Zixiibacteriota bacterium]
MAKDTFKVLTFHGRPASGKSETIDFLKKLTKEERIEKYHIGEIIDIDDFPMLWAWFEEDAILEDLGHERLHTTEDGYFKYIYQWDVLVRRLCLEYDKIIADLENVEDYTIIIEFSRGKQHGGYERAYQHMTEDVLKDAALYYVKVDYEESMRKNRLRKNPRKLHSLLEHSVEEDKLKKLYRNDDFDEFSEGAEDYLDVKGIKLPFGVLDNQEDLTSEPDESLAIELEKVFGKLWENYKRLH